MKSKNKTVRASDVITASSNISIDAPSVEALYELNALFEHNDALPPCGNVGRVGWDKAVALLASFGWRGRSRSSLDRLCRSLGRRSYGTP